ncbi:MAG: hypothetical protein IT442_06060, partial [Phycisphaeraceae bacterium]|nr:hypothetical protein [Phycisphaeraceae bacterium]
DGKVLHVGVWRPKRAATYPVVLICCTDQAPLQKAVIGLTLDAGKPTMILTPTRGLWTDELEGFCQQRKCVLVPLDEVIDVTDTGLAAGAAWQGFLDAFAVHGEIKPRGNFSNRPKPKRAARAAKIEALKKVLVQHIRVARDHAYSLKQAGREPMLLPRPSKGQLAKSAGVKDYHISKCFDDDPQLPVLWDIAGDLYQVMQFGR